MEGRDDIQAIIHLVKHRRGYILQTPSINLHPWLSKQTGLNGLNRPGFNRPVKTGFNLVLTGQFWPPKSGQKVVKTQIVILNWCCMNFFVQSNF